MNLPYSSARMPVVFVSHGSPDSLLNAPAVLDCWAGIGRDLSAPRAILAVSAHWESRVPMASLAETPETIHDFGGFPPVLYRLRYPAPGAPALARRAAQLLSTCGITAELHPDRGLDHGAWVPLLKMFPAAAVPVTQLAVTGQTPAAHHAVGQALAPLRDEGVLILASGAITHNFDWIDRRAGDDAPPYPQALAFADWVAEHLAAQDTTALLDYRSAPHGADSHPTEEHLLPLFVALGAGNGSAPTRLRPPFSYRGLAMDAYVWR